MEELLNYYRNLLIIQYHNKPKAKATIDAFVNLLWANFVLKQMRDAFDVDTAVGKQLDIIGLWVGVDRFINLKPYDNHPWISLIEITGATDTILQGGYSEVSTFDRLGGFLTPDLVIGSNKAELSDEYFRILIKLKIIKNSISHTCKNIDDAIYELFGDEVWTSWDLDNHILYYNWRDTFNKWDLMEIGLKKNVLPCPTVCSVAFNQVST